MFHKCIADEYFRLIRRLSLIQLGLDTTGPRFLRDSTVHTSKLFQEKWHLLLYLFITFNIYCSRPEALVCQELLLQQEKRKWAGRQNTWNFPIIQTLGTDKTKSFFTVSTHNFGDEDTRRKLFRNCAKQLQYPDLASLPDFKKLARFQELLLGCTVKYVCIYCATVVNGLPNRSIVRACEQHNTRHARGELKYEITHFNFAHCACCWTSGSDYFATSYAILLCNILSQCCQNFVARAIRLWIDKKQLNTKQKNVWGQVIEEG